MKNKIDFNDPNKDINKKILNEDVIIEKSNIERIVIFYGILIFLSITANALLVSNKSEFFNFLFISDGDPLSTNDIKKMTAIFDAIYYSSFLIGIIMGIFSDKSGKRKIYIIIGSIGCSLLFFLMTTVHSFELIVLFRFIQGSFHIAVWQSIMVLILDVSNKRNRAKHMGLFSMSLGMAMGIGSILSGYIAEISPFMPYYVAGGIYSSIFILAFFFIKDPISINKRISIKESIKLIKIEPRLIVPSIFNFVDRLHMGFLVTIIPLFLTHVIPLRESLRGMILGLSALPQLIIAYPVGNKCDKSWGLFKPLILGSLGFGITLSVTGFLGSKQLGLFILLLFSGGFFSGFTTPSANALVGTIVEPENNGMATALFNFFGNLGIILGPLIGGYVAIYSYEYSFLVAGLIELISLGINVIISKKFGIIYL